MNMEEIYGMTREELIDVIRKQKHTIAILEKNIEYLVETYVYPGMEGDEDE